MPNYYKTVQVIVVCVCIVIVALSCFAPEVAIECARKF